MCCGGSFYFFSLLLINRSDIGLGSADKIVKAQAVVNRAFREAKRKGDGSHYGIFLRVVP
ncbi:hypothetical protein CRP01_40525 [Flavilitoribacter nigricans DSM 23189 = NBRC 102662]|uniref:Uncharacterized protein n=1 Tax=Flavilitoribacter nigricans (strain ATCC 23147 / DSM 23189 / NBRC 102662 / NCIMB 1420 / SS-2) TaxID=1122177 RepID=A0A2D0MX69_FLAN2|nr:hypothetical protein CRP01_40525 [Flavilitoribacter nigricans DSM 23189 = NBRC 102662]